MSRNVGCFVKLRTRLLLPNPIHIRWCISQLRLKVDEQSRLLLETAVKGEKHPRSLLIGGNDFHVRSTIFFPALIYLGVLSKVGDK